MAGPATILREIHRLRRHARDLQNEIERGPRILKAQQAKVQKQEELLHEAKEEIKRLKMNGHEKESLLKSTLTQIGKHEKQLNESTSKKEYDALKVEIASDKEKCKKIEDDILEGMSHVEEKSSRFPEFEQGIKQAKLEYENFEKSFAGRVADLNEQLKAAQAELEKIELTLPSDIRQTYDREIAARGEDALAAVQNKVCMACYTEITAQAYNDLMLSQFIICKSCGRALYLPE
jgi:predicted  nucleic acid-binding Zn-ribbon protein